MVFDASVHILVQVSGTCVIRLHVSFTFLLKSIYSYTIKHIRCRHEQLHSMYTYTNTAGSLKQLLFRVVEIAQLAERWYVLLSDSYCIRSGGREFESG